MTILQCAVAQPFITQLVIKSDEIRLVQVVSSAPLKNITVESDNHSTRLNSIQSLLPLEYIAIGPYSKDTQVTIKINLTQSESEPVLTIYPHALDVNDTKQLRNIQKWSEDAKSLDEAALSHLEALAGKGMNNPLFKRYLNINLAHLYQQSGQTEKLLALLEWHRPDFERAGLLLCETLSAPSLSKEQEFHILGLLAKTLIQSALNVGTSESRQSQLPSTFTRHCRTPLQARNLYVEDFPLMLQAQRILDAQAIHLEQITSMYLRGLYWFYRANLHNGFDQDLQSEMASMRAIKLMESLPEPPDDLVDLYIMAATPLMREGRFAEANSLLSKGQELASRLQDKRLKARMFFARAFFYREVAELDIAQHFFELAMQTDSDPTFLTVSEQQAKACYNPFRTSDWLAKPVTQLGSIYRRTGQLQKALSYHECAEELQAATTEYYQIVIQSELTKDYFALGEYQRVVPLISELLESPQTRLPQKLDAYLMWLKLQLLTPQTARFDIPDCSKANSQHSDMNTTDVLCNVAGALGYDNLYVSPPTPVSNRIRFPLFQIQLFEILVKFEAANQRPEWIDVFASKAIELLQQYQTEVNHPHAWRAVGKSFFDTYLNVKTRSDANMDIRSLYYALESAYSDVPELEQNIYHNPSPTSSTLDEVSALYDQWIEAEIILANAKPQDIRGLYQDAQLARDRYLGYHQPTAGSKSASPVLTIDQLQSAMPPNTLLLRYFIGSQSAFVLTIDRDHAELTKIQDVQGIRARFSSFRERGFALSPDDNDVFRQLLPEYVISQASITHLVIVADDFLNQFPFSVINVAHDSSPYEALVNRFSLVRTQSASGYFSALKEVPAHDRDLSLFALSFNNGSGPAMSVPTKRSARQLSPLVNVQREVADIHRVFQSAQVEVALNQAATKSFLLSRPTRNSAILHIATHGYFNPMTPGIVGLYTANENNKIELLSLAQLLSQPVKNKLVVLSGCETMLGTEYAGTGMHSVSRGYLVQGAGSTIASLWQVHDRATAAFMAEFYNQLAETQNSSIALQRAKKTFQRSGRFRNPKYWGAFELTSKNRHYEQISFVKN